MSHLLIVLLYFSLNTASAETAIYKRVDEHGNISFSDNSSVQSEKIDLSPAQTYSPPEITVEEKIEEVEIVEEAVPDYQPTVLMNKTNYHAGSSNVDGKVTLAAELRKGDHIIILVNDEPILTLFAAGEFVLENVNPGEHEISAVVQDENFKLLQRSNVATIYVNRSIVSTE